MTVTNKRTADALYELAHDIHNNKVNIEDFEISNGLELYQGRKRLTGRQTLTITLMRSE